MLYLDVFSATNFSRTDKMLYQYDNSYIKNEIVAVLLMLPTYDFYLIKINRSLAGGYFEKRIRKNCFLERFSLNHIIVNREKMALGLRVLLWERETDQIDTSRITRYLFHISNTGILHCGAVSKQNCVMCVAGDTRDTAFTQ